MAGKKLTVWADPYSNWEEGTPEDCAEKLAVRFGISEEQAEFNIKGALFIQRRRPRARTTRFGGWHVIEH